MTENTNIEMNENQLTQAEDVQECTCNKEENPKEKTFTQSRLEEIISERLGRERKQNESLMSVKQLLKTFSDKGLIKGSSYSEMAKELVEKLKGAQSSAQSDEGEMVQEAPETAPVAEGDGAYNAEVAVEENTEKREDEGCDSFVKVLCSIKAKYPKTAVEKLLSGNGFERFAKGRSGSTQEIFDDYYSFMSAFDGFMENEQSGGHSDFASTAFSVHSGLPDEGSNLTKQQMEIAKSAGMSYREYAMLLESVPKRQQRTF